MNRFLRFSFVSLMLMFVANVMAEGITFDFDNDYAKLFPTLAGTSSSSSNDGDFTVATTSTAISGFTVTVSAAAEGVTNANRIWSSSPRLRMYSGTLTVSGKGIKKIEFEHGSGKFNVTASTGTLTGDEWTGEADEVVFTVSKNTQIKSIEINDMEADDPDDDKDEVITVAKALEIINALEDGKSTSDEYEVKGFVVGTPDFQRDKEGKLYGNVNFTMADTKNGTPLLTVFRAMSFENAAFTEETISLLKDGDEVVIEGKLQKYVKNEEMTPEISYGHIESINGATSNVTAIKAVEDKNSPAYKLNGQQVSNDYRGLIVKNGKKLINK